MACCFAVEPGAGAARRLAALVRKLGGKPLRISSQSKVLYHAAATMASPLLVSALQAAVATAGLAGLTRARCGSGDKGARANVVAETFSRKARNGVSAGAFARGDAGTVELHLRALLEHPTLHCTYLALARNAIESLPVRKGLELERVLDSAGKKLRVRD